MLKKTKFFIGLSLIVQSITFFIVFLVLWVKNKSFSKAFLAVGALGGVAGVIITYKALKDDKQFKKVMKAVDSLCDIDDEDIDDIEIPIDETASEAEFEV